MAKKYQGFAFSVRPKNGVKKGDFVEDFCFTWADKKCDYYSIISEKEGKSRHLHLACFLTVPTTKSNVGRDWRDFFLANLSGVEWEVMKGGIKLIYNADWLEKYMAKDIDGDFTTKLKEKLPADFITLENYYSKDSKKDAQEIAKKGRNGKLKVLETLWKKYDYKFQNVEQVLRDGCWGNLKLCCDFIIHMTIEDEIEAIYDPRKLVQTAYMMEKYIKKSKICSAINYNVINDVNEERYNQENRSRSAPRDSLAGDEDD